MYTFSILKIKKKKRKEKKKEKHGNTEKYSVL